MKLAMVSGFLSLAGRPNKYNGDDVDDSTTNYICGLTGTPQLRVWNMGVLIGGQFVRS